MKMRSPHKPLGPKYEYRMTYVGMDDQINQRVERMIVYTSSAPMWNCSVNKLRVKTHNYVAATFSLVLAIAILVATGVWK